MVHCRCVAPTLFPLRGNNRENIIFPYERTEITPAEIRWHTPCRGGYQPPGCFPHGENNVGAERRQYSFKHLQMKFGGIVSEHSTLATSVPDTAKTVLP